MHGNRTSEVVKQEWRLKELAMHVAIYLDLLVTLISGVLCLFGECSFIVEPKKERH